MRGVHAVERTIQIALETGQDSACEPAQASVLSPIVSCANQPPRLIRITTGPEQHDTSMILCRTVSLLLRVLVTLKCCISRPSLGCPVLSLGFAACGCRLDLICVDKAGACVTGPTQLRRLPSISAN